jgi:hypothetical protein
VNFHAKLRRASPIYKHWSNTSKIGGTINGVQFKKEGPRDFVSVDNPLPPDAVSALVSHQDVQLEMTTTPVGSVTVIEAFDLGGADDEDQADGAQSDEVADPFAPNTRHPAPSATPSPIR